LIYKHRTIAFIPNSSIQLAFAGICTIDLYKIKGVEIPLFYYLLIFTATLSLYNFHRLVKLYSGQYRSVPDFENQIRNNRLFHLLLLLAGGLTSLFLFSRLTVTLLFLLIVPAIVAGLYSVKLIPGKNGKYALREIPRFKGIAVAATWTFLTSVVPQFIYQTIPTGFSLSILFLWISQLITFYVITGISDIRDFGIDPPNLKTLVQRFGVMRTIKLFQLLLSFAIVLAFLACYYRQISLNQFAAMTGGNGVLIFLAHQCKNRQPGWFYTLVVDGILLFQWSLFFFLDHLNF